MIYDSMLFAALAFLVLINKEKLSKKLQEMLKAKSLLQINYK